MGCWDRLFRYIWILGRYDLDLHCQAYTSLLNVALAGLFWGAALTKVPKGAWVPLVIGVVL